MSSGQVTAKDRKYAELRKTEPHTKAWRAVYKTKPPAIEEVPEYIRLLVGSSEEEFAESHEIASNHELKIFWTSVMRDAKATMAMRISAASELAKVKGLFAAGNRKKVNEEPKMTPEEMREKIAALAKELA